MNLMEYIKENMVLISDGQELIRDFVDPIKWLSSNYKMSVPGTNKEKVVREELVTVQSFSLLKTPVTNELYNYVMEMDSDIQTKNYPVVNVSWVRACGVTSRRKSFPEFRIDDLGFRIAKNNLEGIQ